MKTTQKVRKILSRYESDNPAAKASLARTLWQQPLSREDFVQVLSITRTLRDVHHGTVQPTVSVALTLGSNQPGHALIEQANDSNGRFTFIAPYGGNLQLTRCYETSRYGTVLASQSWPRFNKDTEVTLAARVAAAEAFLPVRSPARMLGAFESIAALMPGLSSGVLLPTWALTDGVQHACSLRFYSADRFASRGQAARYRRRISNGLAAAKISPLDFDPLAFDEMLVEMGDDFDLSIAWNENLGGLAIEYQDYSPIVPLDDYVAQLRNLGS